MPEKTDVNAPAAWFALKNKSAAAARLAGITQIDGR